MNWINFWDRGSKAFVDLTGINGQYRFIPGTRNLLLNRVSKFSRVYLGVNGEGHRVIVKVLPDELSHQSPEIERFKNETVWYNQHHGLAAPFEYIVSDNRHYLVAEYLPSHDLGWFIKQRWIRQKVRVKLAVQCGFQLLDAIDVIHNKGMIHTDIKPSNVLLLKRSYSGNHYPEFKLIDFGLVRPVNQLPAMTNRKGELPFALVIAPPEQVLGFYELMGFHSDLYNIAILMYEIITGEPVYQSDLTVKLINLQTSFPLPDTKLIPVELLQILKKAAAKYHFRKPPNHYKRHEVKERLILAIADRYKNAMEFKADLETFWDHYQQKN